MATVEQLVDEALTHGGLVGETRGRTVTVAGRRRYTIRVQSDVFRAFYRHGPDYFYPDLAPAIEAAVDARRSP